jgi:pimeloyl-ACP methyl ester carboxylesterase
MARFVLVHGAFAGAWCWERLALQLTGAGHTVDTFDLPGSGDDRTPVGEVTLDAYVARVRAALDAGDEPAVLVGHSMGGAVITHTVARSEEGIARLVYVTAFLPADGHSLKDMTELPEGAGDLVQERMTVGGEPPVATLARQDLYDAFLDQTGRERAEWALDRYRPQPVLPFVTPVTVDFHGLTRDYVITTRDRSIPPALQRCMASERANGDVIELEADHSPYFCRTRELTDFLTGREDRR